MGRRTGKNDAQLDPVRRRLLRLMAESRTNLRTASLLTDEFERGRATRAPNVALCGALRTMMAAQRRRRDRPPAAFTASTPPRPESHG